MRDDISNSDTENWKTEKVQYEDKLMWISGSLFQPFWNPGQKLISRWVFILFFLQEKYGILYEYVEDGNGERHNDEYRLKLLDRGTSTYKLASQY